LSVSIPEQTPHKKPSALLELLRTGLEALAVFLILTYLTGRFEIHQVSMEPNFHEGQRVVVSRLEMLWPSWLVDIAEAAGEPSRTPVSLQRGQIIVLYRSDNRTGDPLIKRLVGLPGDTVEIRDGDVYINGQALDEPYLHGLHTPCLSSCTTTRLGDDEYFVMGDNRPNSMDSRSFGAVHGDQIVGRVFLRYWPLNQLALFP
jgi:signal peptidase I